MSSERAVEMDTGVSPIVDAVSETPRHGFQGEHHIAAAEQLPAGLTIALSREAGSRGASIAQRIGRKLGWQVYNQELIEYIAQEGVLTEGVHANLTPAAAHWAEDRLQGLLRDGAMSDHASVVGVARVVLALAAQGEVLLVGRGAGLVLPRETTLHVRILAPLQDRIAYMSQWLRLTVEQAAEQVRLRDSRRAEFLKTHFRREPNDIYQYDLLLNSSLLGEELSVELIAQAARAKVSATFGIEE